MKRIISIMLTLALSITMLVGCSNEGAKDEGSNEQPKEEVTTKEVKVVSPDGLPSIAVAKMAKEKDNVKDGYEVNYTIEKTSEALSTTVMKEDADIAIVPSNMAAIAYNKTSNYQVAGTVGTGSFYLVSTEDITDFSDLVGMEVGNTGKGLTPDITVQAVLKEQGINTEEINFNYVNSASELVPLLATGKISTGFVPEPALTGLMSKNPDIKIIKGLNDAWKETMESENGYPQSTIIVKSDFAKENGEFVKEFISKIEESVTFATENPAEVGTYAQEIGVSTEAKVIEKSMERSNLKFIKIDDAIEDYNQYYNKLAEFDAKTVGGKLPDEGIYFTEK